MIKACLQFIFWWVIIIASVALFNSLLGSAWGPLIGFVIGVAVAYKINDEWDKAAGKDRPARRTTGYIPSSTLSASVDSNSHSVTYQSGHRGFDHYLRIYAKENEMPGILTITHDGVQFSSTTMRTQQKFTLDWGDIRDITHYTDGWLFQKAVLLITTNKHGWLRLASPNAPTIANTISRKVSEYRDEVARNKQLEEAQIHARNLDAIAPTRFEQLIGQLFESMGYKVMHVGGGGDKGIDLICRDHSNNEIIVQCKRYAGSVGAPIVRNFYGALIHRNAKKGYLVTTGQFTEPARAWSQGKPIELIDRTRLAELLDTYLPTAKP